MESNPQIDDLENIIWTLPNGKIHRLGGPAIIYATGTQIWYQNDQIHRTDGPAMIYADGTQKWYQHNQLHRLDGPAVISTTGKNTWWQYGLHNTLQIESWMKSLGVTWPWNEETQVQFLLAWG